MWPVCRRKIKMLLKINQASHLKLIARKNTQQSITGKLVNWFTTAVSNQQGKRRLVLTVLVLINIFMFINYEEPVKLQSLVVENMEQKDPLLSWHIDSSENLHYSEESVQDENVFVPPEEIDETESDNQARRERVKQVCKSRNVVSFPPVYAEDGNSSFKNIHLNDSLIVETPMTFRFALAPPIKSMGCFNRKVASSSLYTAFLSLKNIHPKKESDTYDLADNVKPKTLDEFLESNNTYYKFMFVRHPMERMLSFYKEKIADDRHPELEDYRASIKKRARKIIASRQKSSGILPKVPSSTIGEIGKPTFEEFLEYILSTDLQGLSIESHWIPYHRYCTPCSVSYDFIGKLETATEDFKYVWRKTGLVSKMPVPWVNKVDTTPLINIALEDRLYRSLPLDLILRFFDAYRMDFELFEYSINEILLKARFQPIEEKQRPFIDTHQEFKI